MKQSISLLILLSLMMSFHVSAQDETPQYRLRTLTAEEYLAEITSIVEATSFNREVDHDVATLVANDFRVRYGTSADITTLSAFYDQFSHYGSNRFLNFWPDIDLVGWNMLIVRRWLEENPTDLATTSELHFDQYTIVVEAYDFNNDRETEWLLYVSRDTIFADYWIARRDSSEATGYRLSRLPIPYRASAFGASQEEWGGAHLLGHQDVNGDGVEEFMFDSYGALPGSGTVGVYRYFYVLGWQNDAFQILTANTVTNGDGTTELRHFRLMILAEDDDVWSFENIDDDAPLEFVEHVRYEDNWQCVRTTFAVHDWNGAYYEKIEEQSTFEENVNCALRQAEDAVFYDDYATAIPFYELTLERHAALDDASALSLEPFAAYAQERLALAYALVGRMNDALALIDVLREQTPPEGTIAAALVASAAEGTTPYELCEAAYDTMVQFQQTWYDNGQQLYRDLLHPNPTNEAYYTNITTYAPTPAYTGCDVARVMNRLLTETSYSTDQTPLEILDTIGIDVQYTQNTDFNNDGIDEWLIWIERGHTPVFFAAADETYRVSFVQFPRLTEYTQIDTITLPNDSGQAWVITLLTGRMAASRICTFYDGNRFIDSELNWLHLWQLQDHRLVMTLEIPICNLPSFDEIFSVDGEIHAWAMNGSDYDPNREFLPETYIWDDEQQIYRLPSQEIVEPSANATPRPYVFLPVLTVYHIRFSLFTHDDFEAVVQRADALFSGMTDTSQAFELHYYRGTGLEMLNQPERALLDYIAAYTAAPHSAWGQLAALHLEPI